MATSIEHENVMPSLAPGDIYAAHAFLHPGVPVAAALRLLVDECSEANLSQATDGIARACHHASLTTFGDLLREKDMSSVRVRPRHRKALRRAVVSWKRRHMRLPTKAEHAALFRLAKSTAAAEAVVAYSAGTSTAAPPGATLKAALTWRAQVERGVTNLLLLAVPLGDGGTARRQGTREALGSREAVGVSLLRTAIEHNNHAMVLLLREQVTVDDLLAAGAHLPLVSAGPLLDALIATARSPAALLGHAVRHWTVSATETLLRSGVPAHHAHLSLAIRRDREGLIDLFLPGGARAPCAEPPLAFSVVKTALDARRADLVLRLLRAGAPTHGGPHDHTIVDRLVGLWHSWLTAACVDVAARMLEGRALAVHNKELPASTKLASHRGAALRLEPVHEVLWERYTASDKHAAHAHCSLEQVRAVCPWVGVEWADGGSAEVHRLFPRAVLDAKLRVLLLVAIRRPEASIGVTTADSLWVSLVGRQLAELGQPPNLEAMRRRAAEEERRLVHAQRVEGLAT